MSWAATIIEKELKKRYKLYNSTVVPSFIEKSKIPQSPGVYIYRDKDGRVIYVGKAINLYHRVASYFSGTHPLSTKALVERITGVDTIVVESELEALILEANLIKKYLPAFNVRLIDDKDYLYIALTKEDFPKVVTARKKDLKTMKKFWGPFPSSKTVRDTLKLLRRVFPWCSKPQTRNFRPCFYYHLGLCPGACVGIVTKNEYRKNTTRFAKFMDGRKNALLGGLIKELNHKSKDQKYEEASSLKKIIGGIYYLTQPNRVKLYLENPNFLEQERSLALEQLKKDLKLPGLPMRIEGYDISNIQGKEATGSMVVLTGGEVDKSQYRKFKIRIAGRPNDVAMHREMLSRRLKHEDWPLPDLIIIDGGRGQVNAAKYEISNAKSEIPVFGLAKRMEWLYPPEGEPLKLPRKSLSLKLLQKIRDESHRFAVSYHRKLRGKILV